MTVSVGADVVRPVDGRAPRRAMVVVALIAIAASMAGIGVRSSFGAHVAVDEPQYLLTALSLFEDGDLDISDELAERRWQPWGGDELPVQTEVLADGSQLSPHDPLLPLLLAVPMGLGGWIGAKIAMALMAGALAALTLWTAVVRFAVPYRIAAVGVTLAAASAPFAVYGQQVYPELPAALAVVAAVALMTAPKTSTTAPKSSATASQASPDGPKAGLSMRSRAGLMASSKANLWALGAVLTALPWLSVKYAPVAAALALWKFREKWLMAGLAVMGVVYLALHKLIWGGWTVYATGDHFQRSGEFGVMGFEPDFAGRAVRLLGLLVDRGYGLAAWQPAWLLLIPAIGFALARRRTFGPLLPPLAAGWLTATFVALTMHGHWWPGRQLVVVLPLALILILGLVSGSSRSDQPGQAGESNPVPAGRTPYSRIAAPAGRTPYSRIAGLAGRSPYGWAGLGLGLAGVVTYGWLVADGLAVKTTWISGFESVGSPVHQALRLVLPDYRQDFWPPHLIWAAISLPVILLTYRKYRS